MRPSSALSGSGLARETSRTVRLTRMTHFRHSWHSCLVALLAFGVCATSASAQSAEPRAQPEATGKQPPPPPAATHAPSDQTTKSAPTLDEIRVLIEDAKAEPVEIVRRQKIVQAREALKRATPPTDQDAAVGREKGQVEQELDAVARRDRLSPRFNGVLVSGFALVDSDGAGTGGTSAAQGAAAKGSDTTASGVGNVVWRSRQFGERSTGKLDVDVSIGGRFGMQPVLTVVTPQASTDSEASTPATPTTTHQNAFVWTAGLQAHMPVETIDSEVGFYGSLGSSLLTTVPKVLGSGDTAQLALPINGKTDANAWRWESGLTFNMYDNALSQIHAESGTLTPQFQVLVAWRRDERFAGIAAFRNPTNRLLFRLTLDALRVLDKRQPGAEAKPYTFSFVVEKERAFGLGDGRLPSAMRYLVRGNVDLLNALPNSASKPSTAKTLAWIAVLPGAPKLDVAKGLSLDAVNRVTLTLNGLATAGKETLKTTPPPTIEVTVAKPASLAIPVCPGSRLGLRLADGVLHLEPADWNGCSVTAVDFTVIAASESK